MNGRFRYRAATPDGQVVEGEVQAVSRPLALEELRRQQLLPIEIAAQVDSAVRGRERAVPRQLALALFARTLATMLSAGVPLDRALGFAARQARHAGLARAAERVLEDVQGGDSLADALARQPQVFGPLLVTMVAAGEESGALDEALVHVADHLDETAELRAQLRAALTYPALMTVASGLGIVVLLLFVVPRFAAMLDDVGGTLPLATRLLVGLSALLWHGWWLLLLLVGAGVWAARWWLVGPMNRRRWHDWRLRWPLVGLLETNYCTARFARALGMVLRSGRPILVSLQAARSTVSNLALRAALERAAEAVGQGKRLHVALGGVLPPLATELLAVGEETSRLDELCLRVAEAYDAEVRRTLRTVVALLEPALILLFALIVGFVALAMLQAMYGLNASVF